jgi:hypothetical protein
MARKDRLAWQDKIGSLMDITRDHILHSRAGKLGAAGVTTVADLQRILNQASGAGAPAGLAIHFHGGLVNAKSAGEIAARLAPEYSAAGAYPLFYIWESGLIETLRNNLGDIARDSVFQELVKKAAEWALKQLGSDIATRGAGAAVDADRLRQEFDEWFAGTAAEPPVSLGQPRSTGFRTRAVVPDEDDLAASIEAELDNDERFQEVIAGLYVASGRGTQATTGATTRGGAPAAAQVDALVDQQALDELFPPVGPGATRGVLTWIKVAMFVAKIVIAVVKRHLSDRDHGGYPTIVEEVLRAAYLDKVGEVIWRSMKKDTADAFGPDPACVGTATLAQLATLAAAGKRFPRITLIGHSTGAIYINHWIEHAATVLPGMAFDIILLAPANRTDEFADILSKRPASVSNFRMFAMKDEVEQRDQLVPIIYPRSLLYLVSGLLEGDVDVPIMGMQRFTNGKDTFSQAQFPGVYGVRDWFGKLASRTVWSMDERVGGLGSKSCKHGDFDNNAETIASVRWILEHGFEQG